MSASTVQQQRDALRSAEDELTKASHLHSAVHEFSEKRSRGAVADADAVVRAFETFLRPGPGQSVGDRRADLAYLSEAHVPTDSGATDFFSAGRDYVATAAQTSAGGSDLSTLIDDLEGFVTGGTSGGPSARKAAVGTVETLAIAGSRPIADHLATLTRLVATAAEANRDAYADALNNEYPSDGTGAETIESNGAVQQYVDSVDDTVAELADDQPLVLLPVRLETRFVGPDREAVTGGRELWVRVYPDRIHHDSHEEHLTDAEVRWGRNFWATLWLATHETLDDTIDRQYLRSRLPDDADAELIDVLLEVDPGSFPPDASERKDALKERTWNQLLERFGRERAAYVVHALKPDHWETIVDTDEVLANSDIQQTLSRDGQLAFPAVDRKPDAWTRPPVARLLPDRWIVYGIWEHEGEDLRETFVLRSNAITEPLPVGPGPEALAVAEQYGDAAGTDGDRATGTDSAVDPEADIGWITDFDEAERAGMAFRIDDADVFDAPTPTGVDDLADGTFRKLIVTGVRSSESPDRSAAALRRQFDVHHYTGGLELLESGTPTNNYDTESGYSSDDDPRESMAIECGPPAIEHGENTDGDMLARALGIDPVTTGSEAHVFAHVENADADYQTKAWHMNSALWSGTLGYYFQNMLTDPSVGKAHDEVLRSGIAPKDDLRPWSGFYEAYRRHFINYVRAQGPLPAFRTDTQPYGVLPAMPTSEDRKNPLEDDGPAMADSGRLSETDPGGFGTGDRADDGATTTESRSIDPAAWVGDQTIETEDGQPVEDVWRSSSAEEFRTDYSVRAAKGSISDEQLAATYPPEEAATVFTKQELATHYEPAAAATVLSNEELRNYYAESALADISLDDDGHDTSQGGS